MTTLCAIPTALYAGAKTEPSPANEAYPQWSFGMGGSWMPGLNADFGGFGRFESPNRLKPAGGGRNYNYDDGFVRVDSSGNANNLTWNWSYENSSQYQPAKGGTIDLSITNSRADASATERDDGSLGMEIFALREMGPVSLPLANAPATTWGIRLGFGFTHVGIRSGSDLETNLLTTTDSFQLGGIVPPPAPYAGSFGGPGPLIGDSPIRTTSESVAWVSGGREIDVDLGVFNCGTYISASVNPKVNLLAEAGLSLGLASGSYEFDSTTVVSGLGAQTDSGKDSQSTLLPGIYAGVSATYQFCEAWSGYASARYQLLDSMDFDSSGTTASLSFESAFVISLGLVHPF